MGFSLKSPFITIFHKTHPMLLLAFWNHIIFYKHYFKLIQWFIYKIFFNKSIKKNNSGYLIQHPLQNSIYLNKLDITSIKIHILSLLKIFYQQIIPVFFHFFTGLLFLPSFEFFSLIFLIILLP